MEGETEAILKDQKCWSKKYENISSRDYVPRYLKMSRDETMSRLMGREYPAPKPFKTSMDQRGPNQKEIGMTSAESLRSL